MGRLGCFLLGGAVGAGIALLFAPRSGEETRALVAEKADEYWGRGQVWYDQGKTRIQDGIAGVQPAITRTGDELRDKIESARTLIAEQVARNAAAARDIINDKVPAASEKINQVADVVRGRIDTAASKIVDKATSIAQEDGVGTAAEAAAASMRLDGTDSTAAAKA
ncbi:MAG: YtxH domain-containing protein [Coriobacteriales bacterium]|jgi:gas vesicle protein|nr:YtxH domain-containing protein [Coriobacteriales bacterium]